jgi:Na+/proline symporter
MSIHPIDAGIVVLYMTVVTILGMWVGRGSRDVSEYLLGDRSLPWWAVLGSIVATETSTATFLSVPGLAWASGGISAAGHGIHHWPHADLRVPAAPLLSRTAVYRL